MSQTQRENNNEPELLSEAESVEEIDRNADQGKVLQQVQRNVGPRRKILSDDFYSTIDERRAASGLVNASTQLAGNSTNLEETLRLRLELNLDLEVRLHAHLHGDITLALLYFTLLQISLTRVLRG